MAGGAAPAQQQAPAPGQLFGMPGLTQFTEQNENTVSLTSALAQATPTTVNGILPFKQVDVVLWWELDITIAQVYTAGSSAITSSPFGPYNWINAFALQIQNQYAALNFTNGIDIAFMQMYRPMRQTDVKNNFDVQPALATASPFANSNLPQPTLQTSTTSWASTATTTTFTLELPASIGLDVYYDLDAAGNVVAPPHRAIVSPQYMAGTVRNILPTIQIASGSSSTLDVGPANIGTGSGTFTGSVTQTYRRVGIYAGNPAAMPVTYAWQYLRATQPFQISGASSTSWPVPTNGQILSLFVRLFDPAANGGLGAAIAMTALTRCQLQYGSGQLRFDDTPKSAQRRFIRQHGFLPPVGVICWDLALDTFGRLTNAYALNTLNTSGILVALTFTGAQSASAYGMMGVEALTYVL